MPLRPREAAHRSSRRRLRGRPHASSASHALSQALALAAAATCIATLAASVAIASGGGRAPAGGARFSGVGGDYFNNGPHGWTRAGMERFSFSVSRSGSDIVDFRGPYSYYCGAGQATATAHGPINPSGRFAIRFSKRTRYGTIYAEVAGSFLTGGTRAHVSYIVDFVQKGTHVRDPYETSSAHALGCASWVHGVARLSGSPARKTSRRVASRADGHAHRRIRQVQAVSLRRHARRHVASSL
ncbi:MAG: hypothetical protein ACYCU0_00455 [Solirubrobacteraceae bacterium]